MDQFDLCVVGAGVVGISIAEYLARTMPPSFSILLVEKNAMAGQETSSRNSEVVHAGLYYPSDSLKARLCVEAKKLLYRYCDDHGVPFRKTGKLIVAQSDELSSLESIFDTAIANGVNNLKWLDVNELQKEEPVISAVCALYSPDSGIVDSHAFMNSLLHDAKSNGLQYAPLTRVDEVAVRTNGFEIKVRCGPEANNDIYEFRCSRLINAAGLHAQTLAEKILGSQSEIIPPLHLSRGCYFRLSGPSPFRHLIYPVPDHRHGGLGIHATMDLTGQVRFGPDVEFINEINYHVGSERKERFVEAIRRYYPSLQPERLQPDYAGIRPRLGGVEGGVNDFVIQDSSSHGVAGLVQLFGIESPGLTASLAIARYVGELLD